MRSRTRLCDKSDVLRRGAWTAGHETSLVPRLSWNANIYEATMYREAGARRGVQSHRSCLDIRQLINMVEYLSIYSKDYLLSYHTHIPVSSFGTKKMQRKRVLTVYVYGGRRHQRVNILGGARLLLGIVLFQGCNYWVCSLFAA